MADNGERESSWDKYRADPTPARYVQAVVRGLAALFEVGGLGYLAWYWKTWESSNRVDVQMVFPSFFAVSAASSTEVLAYLTHGFIASGDSTSSHPRDGRVREFGVAFIMDAYETASLAFMRRVMPVNPLCAIIDLITIALSMFSFVYIGLSHYEDLTPVHGPRPPEVSDTNVALWMDVSLCIIHTVLAISSVVACVFVCRLRRKNREQREEYDYQSELVRFSERQKRRAAFDRAAG